MSGEEGRGVRQSAVRALGVGRCRLFGLGLERGVAHRGLLAGCGFDEVLVDLQHGAVEIGHLPGAFAAIEAGGVAAAARVPVNDRSDGHLRRAVGLAISLGLDETHPAVQPRREDAHAAVVAATRRHGIVAGVITSNGRGRRKRIEQGFGLARSRPTSD